VNAKAKEFLETSVQGLKVLKMRGPGQNLAPLSIGDLPPSSAYELAREANVQEADGIFISCTNFRAMEIIARLEDGLMKPVVTSNQASLWAALRAIKVGDRIKGFGRLLEL